MGRDVRNASTAATSERKPRAKALAGKKSVARDRDGAYGFDRLEVAIRALAERCKGLEEECAALQEQLSKREGRVNALEAELIGANQLRQDVGKRIDELIAQIDLLDAQLESGAS